MIYLLTFCAGLGLYLTGIHSLAHSIQHILGAKFKNLIIKISDSHLKRIGSGFFLGLLNFTSTSATYTCIGLVKSNALSLRNASIISAWSSVGVALIVTISVLNIKIAGLVFLGLIGMIDFFQISHHRKLKLLAPILFSFGIFLLGLGLIRESAHILDHSSQLETLIAWLSDKPFLYVSLGFVATIICQTTSVSSALVIIYSASGLLLFNDGLLILLGANLGYAIGLIFHVSHMGKSAKILGMISALVKVIGSCVVLLLYSFSYSLLDAKLTWFSNAKDKISFKICLLILMVQIIGAIIIHLFSEKFVYYLNYFYPKKSIESLSDLKFIYPEALVDTGNSILLIEQEIQSLINTMPNYLDPLRTISQETHQKLKIEDIHQANLMVSEKIKEFIDQLSLLPLSDASTHNTFKVKEINRKVHVILESLFNVIEILAPVMSEKNSIVSSLVESLHFTLTTFTESDPKVSDELLIDITSDKSTVMQNIRKKLLADTSTDMSVKQRIFSAITHFERMTWLINQIEVSKI